MQGWTIEGMAHRLQGPSLAQAPGVAVGWSPLQQISHFNPPNTVLMMILSASDSGAGHTVRFQYRGSIRPREHHRSSTLICPCTSSIHSLHPIQSWCLCGFGLSSSLLVCVRLSRPDHPAAVFECAHSAVAAHHNLLTNILPTSQVFASGLCTASGGVLLHDPQLV